MSTLSFSRSRLLALCLATCLACAYANVKVDDDEHPVMNTGVGATIIYPGQSPAMPPTHPGPQLPGQAVPAPAPSSSGTLGAAPSSATQQGSGSSTSSSGGGGFTFIGGSEVEEDTHVEYRGEPRWHKYLAAPFVIAAYPFVAIWRAATGDDGPPPPPNASNPATANPVSQPTVDVQTAHELTQLEALENELAGQPRGQPALSSPEPIARLARPVPAGSSISAELAALQRGIPPRAPGASTVPEQARSARSEPQASGALQSGGIADQVTDRNRDGRPDHWVYREDGRPVRELFDEDADGTADRIIFYQTETGEKSQEHEDTDLDGRIDSWVEYQHGQLARHRRDTNGDGFLDTWSFYRDGQLSRQERDLNADGFRDRIAFYQEGRLAREEEDRNGDGRPDCVNLFDDQERIRQRDEDQDGDGIVDLRSIYFEGRLVRRELLSGDAEERIEEEALASAAWSSDEEVE